MTDTSIKKLLQYFVIIAIIVISSVMIISVCIFHDERDQISHIDEITE